MPDGRAGNGTKRREDVELPYGEAPRRNRAAHGKSAPNCAAPPEADRSVDGRLQALGASWHVAADQLVVQSVGRRDDRQPPVFAVTNQDAAALGAKHL
ncbi:MAG TPA: hypothetical protein VKJ07_07225, partial [Mycobacteriales bacterium]|nr:hypothetical protein [Mycobacteriales bacterium]